jgi:hypothetical protein
MRAASHFALDTRQLLACGSLIDSISVRQVPGSARGNLRGNEIVPRNKERFQAGGRVNKSFHPAFPRHVKIDARKVGKNVEASRVASETKEGASVREFLRTNAFQRRAEFRKRRVSCPSIRLVCFYEKIQVLRKAGLSLKDDGVTADIRYLTPWAWKTDKRSLYSWYIRLLSHPLSV